MRLLAVLFLVCATSVRADVLVNSNFADGRAHWKGDAQNVTGSGTGDLSSSDSSTTPGAVLNLKADKWSKIYQSFDVHNATLYYTITFKLSDDYKIAAGSSDDTSSPDFSDVPGLLSHWKLPESEWFFIVTGGKGSFYSADKFIQPDTHKKGEQSLTGKISDLAEGAEGVVLLTVPPGKGSVTLLKISLSATDPNAEP